MQKIIIGILLISISIFGFAYLNGRKQNTTTTILPTSYITHPSISQNTVPPPQETDVIYTFFNLINEKKISEAVMMMSSNIVDNDSTKQSYGVQFSAMKEVKVLKMSDSMKDNWTETKHQYMVSLEIAMDSSSANNPIPYYGFEKGENIRFINLIKENSQWKIEGLATGP